VPQSGTLGDRAIAGESEQEAPCARGFQTIFSAALEKDLHSRLQKRHDDQFMEQGPCGSPQRPHPPGAAIGTSRPGALADTAKTESCFSSALLLHEGHWGVRPPVTMVSNAWPHSRHTYSKMGMHPVYRVLD
jgi:hypothetical protein